MRENGWLLAVVVQIAAFVVVKVAALVNPAATISSPCQTPTPVDSSFSIFCQFNYHNVPYVCDPAGIFSRTELEMLDRNVFAPANLTGCFCTEEKCASGDRDDRLKVVIVTVPSTSINSIGSCDNQMKYVRPLTLHSAALIYTEQLATRWMDYCKADLMMVYIQSWNPERIRKPFIVPLYRYKLEHLSHFSRPESVSRYASPYDVLVTELKSATQIIRSGSVEDVATIPVWAWATGGCLLVLMIAAIYIGNCVTRRIGNRYQLQQKTSLTSIRMANDRWRAGFGGGLITQGSSNMKSSMMFKQFNRRNRHNPSVQKI